MPGPTTSRNIPQEEDHFQDPSNRIEILKHLKTSTCAIRGETECGSYALLYQHLDRCAACHLVRNELGEPSPVMTLAAISWLLALIPGVHLDAGTLRILLFSDIASESLGNLELVAMRVLKASREHSMHISRRGTLKRKMWENLSGLATQLGEKPNQVESELLSGGEENNMMLAEVVANAVDDFSRSQSEGEIRALKRRIAQLENELETQRRNSTSRQ